MKNIIKQNCFYDSILLMQIGQYLSKKFSSEITLMMGTDANKALLKERGMLNPAGEKAKPNDLIICCDEKINDKDLISAIDSYLQQEEKVDDGLGSELKKDSISTGANLIIVSIPGEFVYYEVKKMILEYSQISSKEKLLNHKLCIFIFSDNVPVDEEVKLKKLALKHNVLIMGPDCGTAVINGIGLGFSNVVRIAKDNEDGIGIISAGGSGLQAISCMINNFGYKITEAIGVGGRDLSDKVGGLTTIESIKVLEQDKRTKVIILFSKPPSKKIVKKIVNYLTHNCKKRYVVNFLSTEKYGDTCRIKFASTTYEAVVKAIKIFDKSFTEGTKKGVDENVKKYVNKFKLTGRKYIRGLYSGGSLCEEAMVVFHQNSVKEIYSNVPLDRRYKLTNPWESVKHTIIDYGDDIFTRGKPHPMIDFTFRKERLLNEARDPDVAVIMFDIILGMGSHMHPVEELKDTLVNVKKMCNSEILLCCTVVGTQDDPQKIKVVRDKLERLGVLVFDTNVEMAEFVSKMVKML